MGRSQETFNKKEKEKKKLKKRQDKEEKKAERKANAGKDKSPEDMIAYVDEYGRISSTPPDPTKKKIVKLEDIQISVARQGVGEQVETIRQGVVTFFNDSKGYGFIKDLESQQSIFVHINDIDGTVKEHDKVSFEVGQGQKGPSAMNVKKTA